MLRPAISSLVHGSDLLAVLPTGFGKSLIFQLLIRVKQILSSKTACLIVVCPLKSIVQDHLTLMDLTATSLASASLQGVQNGKYQLIFETAEEILAKHFLSSLKNRIYTTRKTVNRLACKQLHLNYVVSERPKELDHRPGDRNISSIR